MKSITTKLLLLLLALCTALSLFACADSSDDPAGKETAGLGESETET